MSNRIVSDELSPARRMLLRSRLERALGMLHEQGPGQAGRIVRIDTVLAIPDWPYSRERFDEFCKEVGIRC